MPSTVKARTQTSIDERRTALRLRVVAGDIAERAGRRMRARREELGMTQPQVAVEIKKLVPDSRIEKGRVYDWERGYHFPSDKFKGPIAKVLKVEDRGGFGYFLLNDMKPAKTPDLSLVREDPTVSQLKRIEAKVDLILKAMGLSAPEEPPEDLAASGRPPGPPPKKPGEPPIEETPPEPETDEEAGDSDIG